MLNNKKILIATGGTGGHINPALAVAGYIRENYPKAQILFVGTAVKMEAQLVPAAGYDFKTIDIQGFSRDLTPSGIKQNIGTVIKLVKSSSQAKKIIKEFGPDVVLGFGGYVGGPVLRTACKLGIPTAIHEQNAFPGVTTKMLAPNADKVMLAMPEAEKHLKLKKKPIVTGNPIRSELLNIKREEAREKLGLDNRPMILSFGGSLGARRVNESVSELIKWHNGTDKFYHIHATGNIGHDAVIDALKDIQLSQMIQVREYINDMDICMAAADLVICRAGAITLGELQACGKPAILIPSPYVAENHQFHNAMTLKKAGAADIIEEKDLTGEKLIETVSYLIENKPKLEKMSEAAQKSAISDANERIYKVIMELYTGA